MFPSCGGSKLSRSSLLARLDEEQLRALKDRIGERAYRELEEYDDLLTQWADDVKPPADVTKRKVRPEIE